MIKSRKVPDIPIRHAPTLRGQEWPVAGILDSTGSQIHSMGTTESDNETKS